MLAYGAPHILGEHEGRAHRACRHFGWKKSACGKTKKKRVHGCELEKATRTISGEIDDERFYKKNVKYSPLFYPCALAISAAMLSPITDGNKNEVRKCWKKNPMRVP